MPIIQSPNVIIGAGPAGLAVASRFRQANIDFEIIEQASTVAPTWHQHYDRLHLHTVKEYSALPHFPFDDSFPQYIPREDLAAYYVDCAKKMQLETHFNTSVTSVKKIGANWSIQTNKDISFETKNVIIATGFNRVPHRPTFKNEAEFEGTIVHSRDYKNPTPFLGKQVLIIGMGNTGAEIALDMVEQGVQPYLSVRSPINVVPRDFLGRPIQKTARLLRKLPYWLGDRIGLISQYFAIGDLSSYGIEKPDLPPATQLREHGKTPVIDLGTVKEIKAGTIKVVSDIQEFAKDGVVLKNGTSLKVEVIILATGYRAKLEDFLINVSNLLNEKGLPSSPIASGINKGLYFVGFDAYANGILNSIFDDSETVVQAMKEL